jgi:hypothetical protein
MCFGNGGLGKIFAPLANTGLDPVGKATNKALGFEDKKQKEVAVAAVDKGEGTPLSSVLEQKRKLAQGTVLESGDTSSGSVLSTGKTA